MPIQLLDESVIAQIAAGEVVERPASVVKELVENAIDAGASSIHVETIEGGQRRIRISDDGHGILADEVLLALQRHATSKLQQAHDLQSIQTLGFRGEALASISAVSHLTLETRHREEEIGTSIKIEGGDIAYHKPAGLPAGTRITIENLFFNTPARLKFMKATSTEKRHIQTVITQYAMAYPAIRFTLVQDNREVFRSSGTGQLADVVVKVLGLDLFRDMLEIGNEDILRSHGGFIRVEGFVSTPSVNRKDRSRITLFINGRAIQDSGLTYAVSQSYHTLMEKSKHPYAVLMIEVPPDFVDVNVHPTKAEVRFQDANAVFTTVQKAIRQSVVGYAQATRHISYTHRDVERSWGQAAHQQEFDLELNNSQNQIQPAYSDDDYRSMTAIPEGIGQPEKPRTLPVLRVVGQIGAAYIVAEGPAGMYLIDQHAAHCRVIYQQLKDVLKQQESLPHRPIEGQTLDVNQQEAQVLEKSINQLAMIGFSLEPFGTTTFKIRTIPTIIQQGDPPAIVHHLLPSLRQPPNQQQDALLIAIATHAAIKMGQILNTDDMRQLIRDLERCPDPHHSPTGQATFIHMTAEHLERQFMGRN